MAEDRLRLVDRTFVPDVVVEDIGRIDKIGLDAYRILLCRIWQPPETGAKAEREIVASIVTSGAVLAAMVALVHGVAKNLDAIEVAAMIQ